MKEEIRILTEKIEALEKENEGILVIYTQTREELEDLQDSYQDKIVSAMEDRRIVEEIQREWDSKLSSSLNRVITDQSVAIVKEVNESIRVGIMNSMSVFSTSLIEAFRRHLDGESSDKNQPPRSEEN